MLNDFTTFDETGNFQSLWGAAIASRNDKVLDNIDQTTRQITGVSGLQSRISQTFSSTVRTDEVLGTVRPSRKLAVMGVSMISPDGFAIRPRIPANWQFESSNHGLQNPPSCRCC